MRTNFRVALVVFVLLMSAQAAFAQVPQGNIRVDNATNAFIRPCFRLVEGGSWQNFGGIGPFNSFTWPDFMPLVEAAGGVAAGSLDGALIEFTYVDFFAPVLPGNVCDVPNGFGNRRTNVQLDRETNFTIQIGHRARSIELAGPNDKGR